MAAPKRIDLKTPFLEAYAETGKIDVAARAVPMNRRMHYRWLRLDPFYRQRFESAESEWDQRRDARKEASLQEIGKLASPELLKDIASLLRAYSYGPKRKTKRRAASVKATGSRILDHASTPKRKKKKRAPARTPHGVLDEIARMGVFGVKYKDFASAPAAAQKTIRAVAKASD